MVGAAAGSNYDLELPIGNGPTNRACGIDVTSLCHKRTGNAIFDVEAPDQRTAWQQINLYRASLVGRAHEMTGIELRGGSGCRGCLLYTSDAADERSSVDLGGGRIIKKKIKNKKKKKR